MIAGDTFILFNKQMKGNRRELIQFGVPIFRHIKEEANGDSQMGKTYMHILLDGFLTLGFLVGLKLGYLKNLT